MLWFVYNVLFAVGYVIMLPYFLYRMCRRGGYLKGFLQRVAIIDGSLLSQLKARRRVWVHAVSVGEVFVALKFMDEMRAKRPGTAFVLTTTTSTGHRLAEKMMRSDDKLLYFPSDFPFIMRRMLDILNPVAVILVECELWPNLVRLASERKVPVILVNGRISQSSYDGYKKLKIVFEKTLNMISMAHVQGARDRQRLLDIGMAPERVEVVGSAKYDVAERDRSGEEDVAQVLKAVGMGEGRAVVVGGSTWPGEETILLSVYKRLREQIGNMRLVIVPRHAERAGEVVAEIERCGLKHTRRSELRAGREPAEPPDVLLVDTTGELKSFYALAAVVFVGKSLTRRGGQNIIEPALYGRATVVGPHMENFAAVMDDFLAADAIIVVRDEAEMEDALRRLLADERLRLEYGRRAGLLVDSKRGAIGITVEQALKFIPSE